MSDDREARLAVLTGRVKAIEDGRRKLETEIATITGQVESQGNALRDVGYPVDQGVDAVESMAAQDEAEADRLLAEGEAAAAQAEGVMAQVEGKADAV